MTLSLGIPSISGMPTIPVDALIERLGGTSAVAEFFDIKPPSVSEWRARGVIPDDKLMLLAPRAEQVTEGKWKCEDIAPHVTWRRVRDRSWPWHARGKPLVDVMPTEAA